VFSPVNNEPILRRRLAKGIAETAKKLLPPRVVREVQQYRAYGKDERSLYLKIRMSNGLGITNPRRSRLPPDARSILFVCFGNIMRSPMCEALLKRGLANFDDAQFNVTSAGLNAIPDWQAHTWAITAAREFGVSLEGHRARLLTSDMVHRANAIFAMDYHNQVQLFSRWPDHKKKILLLSAYANEDYPSVEISDPYYAGLEGTRSCYSVLNTCIENLAHELLREGSALRSSQV
jgi:protein-tyrosine phosphatase